MFGALMPALFVPEERWGAGSWRANHPYTVDAQIDHGLRVARYGVWGFSPSNTPGGGYGAYGVDAAGMDPNGMPSNEDATLVDRGFAGCPGRPPVADPPASAYTNGVVTPHAAFLALRYRPQAAVTDLARLEAMPGMYGTWGFRDSVNVTTGHPSGSYLSLDQGMIMAALGNALGDNVIRRDFVDRTFRHAIRPVLGVEEFGVPPAWLDDHRHPWERRPPGHPASRRDLRSRRRRPDRGPRRERHDLRRRRRRPDQIRWR